LPTSAFVELELSYNAMTGTIPVSIQHHQHFDSLDLSHNRIQGTLVDDFAIAASQSTLSLAMNRLSGPLPQSIIKVESTSRNLTTLDVLAGNIFDCQLEDIPTRDVSSKSYSCGSYEWNISSYVYLGFLCCLACFLAIGFYFWYHRNTDSNRDYYCFAFLTSLAVRISYQYFAAEYWYWIANTLLDISRLKISNHSSSSESEVDEMEREGTEEADNALMNSSTKSAMMMIWKKFPYLSQTKAFLVMVDYFYYAAMLLGFCFITIITPVYLGLNFTSAFVTYSYGYVLSISFLHGKGPVIFMSVFLSLLAVIILYTTRSITRLISSHLTVPAPPPVPAEEGVATGGPSMTRVVCRYLILGVILFWFHISVLAMMMSFDSFYVDSIVTNTTITRNQLFVIQGCLAVFKMLCYQLTSYLLPRILHRYQLTSVHIMQQQLFAAMLIFIISPCIATAMIDQSCFYYIFQDLPLIRSTVRLVICQSYSPCVEESYVFVNSYNPSFQYTYECGTMLLLSYVPILMYVYSIYGLTLPIGRFLYAILPNLNIGSSSSRSYDRLSSNSNEEYFFIRIHGR
jgi:hypothetical protein